MSLKKTNTKGRTSRARKYKPPKEVKPYAGRLRGRNVIKTVTACVTADDTDEPLYIVEYPDGTISAEGYNALLNAITVQTDENGNEYHSFKAILDH